jgi:WD40 repeat protein
MRNCVIACVLICFLVGSAAQAEVRTWKARKGNFSVKAELVDVQNGKVELKKEDGTTITVPLDQLSLADVRYVDQYLKKATESIGKEEKKKPAKSPGKKPSPKKKDDSDTETPATEDETEMDSEADREESSEDDATEGDDQADDSEMPADEEEASTADDAKETEKEADADAEKDDAAGKKKRREPPLARPKSANWQVRIDVDKPAPWSDVSIDLPDSVSLEDLALPSTPSTLVAVNSRDTGLYLLDIRSKKRVGPIKSSDIGYGRPAVISPDGDLVAITPSSAPVQIWSLRKKTKLNEIKFGGRGSEPYIHFATFAGPNRLVVSMGYNGGLVIVNPHKGTEIAAIETKLTSSIDEKSVAISPCGTYVAVAGSFAPVRIFDTRNGALAGELVRDKDYDSYSCESLAFSPDGSELAALLSGNVISCWSMKNGKPVELHKIDDLGYLSDRDSYTKLEFMPGKKGWLLGGRVMVDRPKGRMVWKSKEENSDGPWPLRMLDENRMLSLSGKSKDCRIVTTKMPWEEVEKATAIVEKGGEATDIGMPPLTVAKSGGRKLKLPDEPRRWSVPKDTFKGPELKQARFSLPKHVRTYDPPRIAPQGGRAILSFYTLEKSGRLNTSLAAYRQFDLSSGKQQDEILPDFESKPLDVGLDGSKLVLATSKKEDRIDIYAFDGAKHLVGFRPYSSEKDYAARVNWAYLVDDKHLLTCSGSNHVVLWSIPDCKPVYTIENLWAGMPMLSPSRKFMIARVGPLYHVFNLATGDVIGNLKPPVLGDGMALSGYDFSDDGSKLAAIFRSQERSTLVCWDMATGKLVSQHRHADGEEPLWLDDGRILIQSSPNNVNPDQRRPRRAEILELESARILWRYQLSEGKFALRRAGGLLWYAATTPKFESPRLVGCTLPDGKAKATIDSTTDLPELLPKGTAVTLNISVKLEALSDGIVEDALRTKISDLLTKRGLKIEERTALALQVSVTSQALPKPENQFNAPPASGKSDNLECRLELTDVSRNVLWATKQIVPPLSEVPPGTRPGQNMKQLQWAQAERWLTSEAMPEKVYEVWVYNGMGESLLDPSGETVLTVDAPKK